MKRLLTVLDNIRKGLLGITLLGVISWQTDWMPDIWLHIAHFITLIAAILALIHEIGCVRYFSQQFIAVDAEVIHHADKRQDNMKVSTFLLKYKFEGADLACTYDDDVISHTIRGRDICRLLVYREDPTLVFIDTFRFRYLNLIMAIFLLCCVISMYGVFA